MKQSLFFSLSFFLFINFSAFAQEAATNELESLPITSMEFEDDVYMFGEIYQGESVQNVFTFTNTGDEPLILLSAKGSCGCTVPSWPKEPILPGETGELLVRFNSKGKKGAQSKRVTITSNTDPKMTYLTLKGEIVKGDVAAVKVDPVITRTETKTSKANLDVDSANLSIYPNPASEKLNLELKGYEGTRSVVDIFNIKGERMTSKVIQELSNEPVIFDINNYESGTYTVSIKLDGLNRITKQVTILND